MKRLAEILTVLAIFLVPLILGSIGIRWGLPSKERTALYFSGPEDFPDIPEEEVRRSAELYPEFSDAAPRDRRTFNAIRSCHPDEHYVLKGLANMDPKAGDFTTGLFGWPSLIFYIEGVGLAIATALGFVTLTRDPTFYFRDPEQLARMYLVGRVIVVVFGAASAVVVYRCGRDYYNQRTGVVAGLVLGVLPLTTVHMHYMTGDIPMLFFAALGLYFCLRSGLSPRARWPVLAGIALGLAMSAKYKAVILVPLIPAAAVLQRLGRGRSFGSSLVKAVRWPVLVGMALAAAVFLALNPSVVLDFAQFWRVFSGEVTSIATNVGAETQAGTLAKDLPGMLERAFASPAWIVMQSVGVLPLVLAVAAGVIGIVWRTPRDLLPAGGLAIVYLTMGVLGTVYARHLMPLVPLVALLSARCLFTAWNQIRQPRLQAFLTVALGVLLLAPPLWKSVAYCRLFSAKDVRLDAAQWIRTCVPEGSVIGMPESPWQYDTPPVNEREYRVVVTGYDAERLSAVDPEYYLVSSRHSDPILRKPTAESKRFWSELTNGKRYAEVRVVERMPFVYANTARAPSEVRRFLRWLGVELDNAEAPEDMRYANPVFTIYRRRDLAS